jgi:two-component system OmpR family sensor kinase
LSGDITLLARALANIVENAKKYGEGVASARLRRVDTHIHFEILDGGTGFTQDLIKVFEPFVRSPQAETLDPTSMGLGLTLVKRVAEAHGGKAYCENLPTGGACVGFSVEVVSIPQKGTPIPNSNTGNGPKTYNG